MVKNDSSDFDALEKNLNFIIKSIELCLTAKLQIPSLILLYSGIDIIAWLNRPTSKEYSSRKNFIRWVDNYLLPNPNIKCKAIDLYAARCAIIHSYSFSSRLSEEGKAKEIYYAWGKANVKSLQNDIDSRSKKSAIAIHINDFLEAFKEGVEKFKLSIKSDKEKEKIVCGRANKYFFTSIPSDIYEKLRKEQITTE
ncbi:MAG: hypothetical protein L6305_03035 [Actinomycetia bacterium]|nr:hypothetical protein [Actinomycetes bacterium]